MNDVDNLDFEKMNGLLPVVVQECYTRDVLMLAYMNQEALEQTLETGIATYWSREQKKMWVKGETSGNYQFIREIFYDCDGDALLIKVEQKGDACHNGYRSCFYRGLFPRRLRRSF